ncbi:MAG: ribulose-phosphate 3-epimerase, partial [Lactobacillus crispatus]|nr:ribulose-phosphate 3-epimerase [Lactobacillus crispatus]
MIISPSILNADNLNLGRDIKKATQAGITRFHIDI